MRIISVLILLCSFLLSQELTPDQIEMLKKVQGKNITQSSVNKDAAKSDEKKQVIVNNVIRKEDPSDRKVLSDEELETVKTSLFTKENIEKALSVTEKKERYGSHFFNNINSINPYSLPTPESYLLNYGDKISVKAYGIEKNEMELNINSDGKIDLPFIGKFTVFGMSFKDVKRLIKNEIKKAYPETTDVIISILEYSPIQIVVSGLVEAPGLYNLSTFSTVKDAIMVSGGILDEGSYRNILIKRAGKVIKKFDLYNLLLDGDLSSDIPLKNGDIIVVKEIEKEIEITGDIKNSTKYELVKGEGFDKLLDFARGFKVEANKNAIRLKRYEKDGYQVYNLTLNELFKMTPKNEDKIHIYSKNFNVSNYVTIVGNIAASGEKRIPEDKKLSTLLNQETKKFGNGNYFLNDTNFEYGYVKNNISGTFKSFNLKNVIEGKENIVLNEGDQINILKDNKTIHQSYVLVKGDLIEHVKQNLFKRVDIEENSLKDDSSKNDSLKDDSSKDDSSKEDSSKEDSSKEDSSTKAEIKEEIFSKIDYFEGLSITDLFNMVKFKENGYFLDRTKVKVSRIKDNRNIDFQVFKDSFDKFKLKEYDEVEFYDKRVTKEEYKISIKGEVFLPGDYNVGKTTRLKDIIDLAGGLTKKALTSRFEIVRYDVKYDQRQRTIMTLDLNRAMEFNIAVKPDDEITIFSIPNWNEKEYVEISGLVKFPGKYPIEKGEKLSSLIERAGGFLDDAFIEGAIFTREEVQQLQEKKMNEAIRKLQMSLLQKNLNVDQLGEVQSEYSKMLSVVDTIKEEIAMNKPIGRVSINLLYDLNRFKNSNSDITLKDKDMIFIPSMNDTITVLGEVLNQNTFIFDDELNVDDYIAKAGGYAEQADEDLVYIIKANGEAAPIKNNYFWFNKNEIFKGDTIIVPLKVDTFSDMQFMKDVGQILYQIAITAASLKTLGAL